MAHAMTGKVKFFNDQKGFGFIIQDSGEGDVFFHVTQCSEGYQPQEDDLVEYEIGEGRDGRPAAQQVTPAGNASDAE
jgi:cold shock protein